MPCAPPAAGISFNPCFGRHTDRRFAWGGKRYLTTENTENTEKAEPKQIEEIGRQSHASGKANEVYGAVPSWGGDHMTACIDVSPVRLGRLCAR